MKQEDLKNFVEEIWENMLWEGMEAVLYKDGDNWTRQEGAIGIDENEIIYTLPLSFSYWCDSYSMYRNEDGDVVKDEAMKDCFVEDMTKEIEQELDL